MDFIKLYLFKLIATLFGVTALVFYILNFSMNIVVSLLALGGIILFIDTKINKDNIFLESLKIMNKKSNDNKKYNDNKKNNNEKNEKEE